LFCRPTPTALVAHVADFISARDGHAADPKDIFLTNGASAGVAALLSMRWVCAAARRCGPRLCAE
jgi:alanine transaminase